MNTDLTNTPHEAPTFDYIGMVWRRKWLLIFGSLIGWGLGFLWYNKQAPVYQSSAEIQITNPKASRNLPIEGLDYQGAMYPLVDEIRVIRSELVLEQASEIGALTKTNTFDGLDNASIAAILSGSSSLDLTPTNGNIGGSVITVSYSCNDPNESCRVVQSIIESYQKYLKSFHQDVGQETVDIIDDARGDVHEKLTALESEYDAFKTTNMLVDIGGSHTSVHRTNAEQMLLEKQKLMIQRTNLYGQFQAINTAIEAKQEPKAILALLQGALGESVTNGEVASADNKSNVIEMPRRLVSQGPKRSELMRRERLFPLELEYKKLENSYAKEHPALVSLRIQIEGMTELIEELEEGERNLEAAMEKELEEMRAEAEKANLAAAENPINPADELQRQIRIRQIRLEQELTSIDQQLSVVSDAYNSEREAARGEERDEIKAAGYERDISRQRELYGKIVARLDELKIVSDVDARRVSVLNSPKRGWQIAPSKYRNMAMGCFLGLLGAAGIAYLFEWSDKSYHSPDEIAEHLRMPVIGHIPAVRPDMEKVKAKRSILDPSLCTYFQPKSTFCEAYRAVRTALYFSNQSGENKIIQVTSAVPSDGKSTITANLAITTAQAGKSVLLIDCDFRRPRVHQLFKLEAKKGVAWMVENMPEDSSAGGGDLLGEALYETEIPNLSVMPCGERPANPAELLSSQKFEQMLQLLREKFDLVLIDSPPLLAVTDPSNVAARVDGVILVIRIRKVVRPMAVRASRILETLGANVLGVVVNGVGSREAYGYGSSYYRSRASYYGADYYRSGYGYSYGNSYGVGDGYEYGNYYEEPGDRTASNGRATVSR